MFPVGLRSLYFFLSFFQTKRQQQQQRIDLFVGFALSEDGRLEFIAFLLGTLMAAQLESRDGE